jgi:hypothetical protein
MDISLRLFSSLAACVRACVRVHVYVWVFIRTNTECGKRKAKSDNAIGGGLLVYERVVRKGIWIGLDWIN